MTSTLEIVHILYRFELIRQKPACTQRQSQPFIIFKIESSLPVIIFICFLFFQWIDNTSRDHPLTFFGLDRFYINP